MDELAWERAFRERCVDEGMRWETVRFRAADGAGDTVAHHIRPAGEPRGVALALHGAGNDALFGWVGTFRALLRSGLEVFTFHLDGHGRGGATRFSAAGAAASVGAALERTGARARGLPLHAVGVSLGGSVLLAALPALGDAVATASLVVAPLRIRFSWRAVAGEVGPGLLRTVWRERRDYGWSGLVPSFGPWKRELYPLRLAEAAPPGAFGYVEVLNRALDEMRLEEAAAGVRAPTLLVYGEADRVVPAEQGERLAGLIPAARLHRVSGGTHLTTPLRPEVVRRVVEWTA